MCRGDEGVEGEDMEMDMEMEHFACLVRCLSLGSRRGRREAHAPIRSARS